MRDSETEQILLKSEEIKNLVGSAGWKHVRAVFEEKILALQHVNAIVGDTATAIEKSLKINKKVSEALYEILADVEGTAATYELLRDPKAKSYIYKE